MEAGTLVCNIRLRLFPKASGFMSGQLVRGKGKNWSTSESRKCGTQWLCKAGDHSGDPVPAESELAKPQLSSSLTDGHEPASAGSREIGGDKSRTSASAPISKPPPSKSSLQWHAIYHRVLMARRFSVIKEQVATFMAPREKGDMRDVVLMSLSFAVLVYISQRLVCVYCLLRSSHF